MRSQSDLLQTCEACGKDVSKTADSCPHCGQKSLLVRRKEQNDKFYEKIGIGIFAVLIAGYMLYAEKYYQLYFEIHKFIDGILGG